jgi:endonuclease G
MKIPSEILEKCEHRAPVDERDAAEALIDRRAEARYFGPKVAPETELAKRAENLSFAGAQPSPTEYERMLGTNDLVDEFYLERALVAARPVCRLILRNEAGRETGWATGFMVSPRILLTNWHVFETGDDARNAVAEFEYRLDIRGNPMLSVRFLVRPDRFYASNRDLDYAVVAVEETSMDGESPLAGFGYHRLIPTPGKILEREWITIIQHPGGQRRQFAIRENRLIAKEERFLWYMSDTAPGSSGAPAFNDSFQVVALHHAGKAKRENGLYVLRDGRKVPSIDDVDDVDVLWEKNEGLRVSVLCADMNRRLDGSDPYVRELKTAMTSEEGHVMARWIGGTMPAGPAELARRNGASPGTVAGNGAGISIPLQLHLSLSYGAQSESGRDAGPPVPPPTGVDPGDGLEKVLAPPVDTDYANRKGYDPAFLGQPVPLPEVSDLSLVSRLDDGDPVIPYEHFSLVMHKLRRLAVYTASNVDGREAKRRPEPGLYTRKALFGLKSKNDREGWITDPRIPRAHQLPEVFFDKDGGAFDKGHLVRREDVCWGGSRDQIVKANADSYHMTNCSPQIAAYNQASRDGLWGRLEDFVLAQVEAEQKFTVIAGPVLDSEDKVFEGRDLVGPARVQIPKKFWKVVVAEKGGELQAFAFVLEQSLKEVPLSDEEFQITEEWEPFHVSIEDLEATLGIVRFPQVLKDADRFGTGGSEELMRAGGIRGKKALALA